MLRSYVSLLRVWVWLELEEQHLIFLFSVWNLVTIALERYLAVCRPFKYANFTKSKVMLIFILMYIMSIICSGGSSFQVNISPFFKKNDTLLACCVFKKFVGGVSAPGVGGGHYPPGTTKADGAHPTGMLSFFSMRHF